MMKLGRFQMPAIRMRWLPEAGIWAAIILAPIALNYAIWASVVASGRRAAADLHEAKRLGELKPELQAMLKESDQLLGGAEQGMAAAIAPEALVPLLQQTARQHRVDVTSVKADTGRGAVSSKKGKGKAQAAKAKPGSGVKVSLAARGRYSHLAEWMAALETHPALQLESWRLAAASDDDEQRHALQLELIGYPTEQ